MLLDITQEDIQGMNDIVWVLQLKSESALLCRLLAIQYITGAKVKVCTLFTISAPKVRKSHSCAS